ncbi:hypothetical protein [Nonomuraea rubra]|uniref:hypothetical protein n=1 Tax=Nonomuraea rubra TaxID=46180 RepID=UPI0033C437C5
MKPPVSPLAIGVLILALTGCGSSTNSSTGISSLATTAPSPSPESKTWSFKKKSIKWSSKYSDEYLLPDLVVKGTVTNHTTQYRIVGFVQGERDGYAAPVVTVKTTKGVTVATEDMFSLTSVEALPGETVPATASVSLNSDDVKPGQKLTVTVWGSKKKWTVKVPPLAPKKRSTSSGNGPDVDVDVNTNSGDGGESRFCRKRWWC